MGQKAITKNTLFYGDNLDIMRQYLADESVDLIYLDPPFNSSRNYNVLYKDESGVESEAQIRAFDDTWHWSKETTEPEFAALKERGDKLAELLTALVSVIGRNPLTAYLVMMSSRLIELHRVLKPTGSLYLHCDPTASHYLKMILDMIFGAGNFRSEIIWKRTSAHSSAKRYGPVHDTILFYSRSEKFTWNQQYEPFDEEYLASHYRNRDTEGRQYTQSDLTASGTRNGSSGQVWRGFDPASKGNHWKFTLENLERLDSEGRIYWPANGGWPRYKRYLDEVKGIPLQDVWVGIDPINAQAAERLGYPTQKPIALLERIIQASSNPGDVVLDPFCGCGTATHAAQKLGRTWIGIDITYLATTLIKSRLADAFGLLPKKDYDLIGEPTTLSEAQHLATQDRYQFQWWALGLLPARPQGGTGDSKEGKKGSDNGIDGVMTFQDDLKGTHKRILVQVKSGKVKSGDIRDLLGTVNSEKNAVMGVFVTLEPPSRNMETAALSADRWQSENFARKDYPKIQILTIEELLNGKKVEFPDSRDRTLSKAQREQDNEAAQRPLL